MRKLKHVREFKPKVSDMPLTKAILTLAPYFSPLALYVNDKNNVHLNQNNYQLCTSQSETYCK